MRFRFTPTMIFVIALSPLVSTPPLLAKDTSLVDLLTQEVEVTKRQARGGAGAIFDLAKEKLSPQEFSHVSQAVPDMDEILEAAPPPERSLGGMFGEATTLFGGSSSNLGGLANLASSFSQLGLSPEMVNQFVPVILQYVKSNGGETVSNLLAAVLQ